jgi:serine/threonine protein kinase
MSDWLGKTLGKVNIESLIARGGMAEVYLGTHSTLNKKVAVKVMRGQMDEDAEAIMRFKREAQASQVCVTRTSSKCSITILLTGSLIWSWNMFQAHPWPLI